MPGFSSVISNNVLANHIITLAGKQVQGIGVFDDISGRDGLDGGDGNSTSRVDGFLALVKDADGSGTTKAYIFIGGDSGDPDQGEYISDADWTDTSNWKELSTFTEVSQDTSPQLGGNLDVNGNSITSASNGNITIDPNGTGNVLIGNFTFDADQSVGAGQDNYVLTYDNGTGLISLEAATGGGGGIDNVSEDTTPTLGGTLDAAGFNIIEVEDIGLRDRIFHDGDTDTYIQFVSNDAYRVVTGNVERMYLNGTSTVFNETGASVDFRVEGDTAQHLLFVDASADKVGINNSTPSEALDVTGNIAVSGTVDGVDIATRDHDAVSLDGTPDYITISGQVITRNAIDLANDVTGTLPNTNTTADSANTASAIVARDASGNFSAGTITANLTGNASGTAATVTAAAQPNITSLGTLTSLTVDDVAVDGKVITLTGSTGDTATLTAGTNGTLDIVTTDAGGASANIQITADGTAEVAGTTVTLDSSGNITLDADGGTITFADAGVSLGTITSSGYSGKANTAGALHTAVNINGVSFDGSGDVTVPAAGSTLTDTVTVAKGGTGTTSFTDKSVVITQDAGTDTLSAVSMATNGQLLIGGTSGPAVATLSQGDNISITNGDGTISIASSHPTISAAASSDNSGRTYIQDITLDSNGHVTGLTTATETVTNTDGRINDVRDNDTSTTISSVSSLRFTGDLCAATGAAGIATVTVGGNINRLTDVDDTISPTAGDVLIYNATAGKYEPQTLTEGTNITITNADGSITIAAPNYTAGDGLTLTGTDFDIDAAQTLITSVLNSNLKLGTSATQEYIDFGAVANTIRFLINNTGVLDITSGGLDVSGNIDVGSNNLSVNGKVGDTANNDHISFETDGEVNIMTNNVERMSVTDSGVEVSDLNTTRNIFEKTSNTDHDYQGDIVKFGSGTLQQGRLCYYNNGTWAAADANNVVSSGGCLLGIALGSSPTTDGLLIKGMYTMAADMGTDGDELYVSGGLGQITNTAPSANGDVVRVVGYCLDSTNGQIWFNPSSDWIEVSA